MEQRYATIEKDDKSYVKKYEDVEEGEHVTGVFLSKVGACNTAQKIERQSGLKYVSVK